MNCYLCGSLTAEQTDFTGNIRKVRCPACGHYAISLVLERSNSIEQEKERKYLLSALTRQASDAGRPITLTTENLHSILESVPYFASPIEKLELVLLLVSKKQNRADSYVNLNTVTDYPLVFAHDFNEYNYFIGTLIEQGLLEGTLSGNVSLTPAGWEKATELQKFKRDSNQAFIAMWFNEDLKDAWENGFKPALLSTRFSPYRVDLDEHNGKIDDRIISEIRRSGLLVADFTGHRGGVYFEAGFAMGLGIPVIWTCRDTDISNIHFDTRQYNHIVWTNPDDLQSKLTLRIKASIPGRE